MIATVTLNPAVDHTIQLDSMPGAGGVARTDTDRFDAGGKGINVAQYLHQLGADTVATGLVGNFLGEYIREELEADGISTDLTEIDGRTRLNTTILDSDGEYKINHSGPTVDEGAVDEIVDVLRAHEPTIVLIGGSLPPGLTHDGIDRIARGGAWETSVDVGGQLLARLDGSYALCKPNRPELRDATGMAVESVADCIAAAETLRQEGYNRVVTSLGGDGALMVDDERVLHAAALDVEVADTVGAGDAMLSGVLFELAAGNSSEQALRRGIAVASRVVSVPGTRLPDTEGIDALTQGVEITEHSRPVDE